MLLGRGAGGTAGGTRAGRAMTGANGRVKRLPRAEKERLAGLLAEQRRRAARHGLIAYTEATLPGYAAAPHHRRIAARLEAVAAGARDRLMIVTPPRHGKSELASTRFPAWFLGRHPEKEIIAASYNLHLARHFGRGVRNLMASPEHRAISPAARLAAGVDSAVTGRGAHVFIIDDPVKSRAEAESETARAHA